MKGFQSWCEAKEKEDFNIFAPNLDTLVQLSREAACLYGYEGSPYNALIPDFDEGLSIESLDRIFTPLQASLTNILQEISDRQHHAPINITNQEFSIDAQKKLSLDLLSEFGFELRNGCHSISAHPFSLTAGPEDFRITSRFRPNELMSGFLATAHEVGHSLYERGLPKEEYGNPCGKAGSAAIHESQSLFWENKIAGSRAFLDQWFHKFQEAFPKQMKGYTSEDFYRSVNHVQPDYIRVEADEVCYCLHILVRYQIEKSLFSNNLDVRDIPDMWNSLYKDYLNITPPKASLGCLQDMHWSEGLFGYFPSYALGHLISAQFTEVLEKEMGPLEPMIYSGKYSNILSWLNENIHSHGSRFDALQLSSKISGQELSGDAFIKYLRNKYLQN